MTSNKLKITNKNLELMFLFYCNDITCWDAFYKKVHSFIRRTKIKRHKVALLILK